MNYYEDFVKTAITHGVCCHKGVNLGSFAAFCKEESSADRRIFRFYIEEGMHDADVADMKAIVNDHFPNPVFVFIPHVPEDQIKQMIAYSLYLNQGTDEEDAESLQQTGFPS